MAIVTIGNLVYNPATMQRGGRFFVGKAPLSALAIEFTQSVPAGWNIVGYYYLGRVWGGISGLIESGPIFSNDTTLIFPPYREVNFGGQNPAPGFDVFVQPQPYLGGGTFEVVYDDAPDPRIRWDAIAAFGAP